jgi:hypothetical protein
MSSGLEHVRNPGAGVIDPDLFHSKEKFLEKKLGETVKKHQEVFDWLMQQKIRKPPKPMGS